MWTGSASRSSRAFLEQMKEAARQKPVAEQIRQAKEAAPKVKTKKHKERDTR